MASLFANRNRRSQRSRNAATGRGAGLMTRTSGRGRAAPTRSLSGAASGARQISAARQGTLLQHQLQQSDQSHGLNMAQGKASLRKQRLGNERYEGVTPLHLEGMELDNTGKEKRNTGLGLTNTRRQQQIDQADEMNPLLVEGQKTTNTGRENANTRQQQQIDQYEAGATLRNQTRENQERVAGMRGSLLKSDQISYDENGNLVAQGEAMSPEQAALAGIPLRKPVETGNEMAAVDGMATQAANIAAQGGSVDEFLADTPPEMVPVVRERAKSSLLEEGAKLEDAPRKAWWRWDGNRRKANTDRFKNVKEALRGMGVTDVDKAIEGYRTGKARAARAERRTQGKLRSDNATAQKALAKEQMLQ